jgi:hypothetical protein
LLCGKGVPENLLEHDWDITTNGKYLCLSFFVIATRDSALLLMYLNIITALSVEAQASASESCRRLRLTLPSITKIFEDIHQDLAIILEEDHLQAAANNFQDTLRPKALQFSRLLMKM